MSGRSQNMPPIETIMGNSEEFSGEIDDDEVKELNAGSKRS